MDLAVPLVEPEASDKPPPEPPPPLIIKADELDAAGTDVSTPITPALVVPPHPPQSASPQPMHSPQRPIPTRPILRREGSTPAPPVQRLPLTPEERSAEGAEGQLPTDSLSLQQLRRLVTDMPKLGPQAYAYEHADTRSFAEEIEEWFPYSEEERYMLLRGKEAFETRLERWAPEGRKWVDVTDGERDEFARAVSEEMEQEDDEVEAVECLGYLAMGCWGDTAGMEKEAAADSESAHLEKAAWGGIPAEQYQKSKEQIDWMRKGCQSLARSRSVQKLFNVLRKACDNEQSVGPLPPIPIHSSSK